MSNLIVARDDGVFVLDPERASVTPAVGLEGVHPMCLAVDPRRRSRIFAGTRSHGVFRSDDAGRSWTPAGLAGRRIMALGPGSADGTMWAGGEPSRVWRSRDGTEWQATSDPTTLPSSPEWSFPPRPQTHHVRWIACHPHDGSRVWAAIEAGALIRTHDGGATWMDRVAGGPRDTHELAIHPGAPECLRVAAGDGMFVSDDGGRSWERPMEGLDVGYMRSVAIDPGDPARVLISGASAARKAYTAGRSDGRVYQRSGSEAWQRVRGPWTDPPETIAPLLRPGTGAGEVWAGDDRGLHRSDDGGASWSTPIPFEPRPRYLTGLVVDVRSEA